MRSLYYYGQILKYMWVVQNYHQHLVGGRKPSGIYCDPIPHVTKLRYKAAPQKRPLHKTRFR